MRNVPPGIQIILSISEGLSQIATSDVSLAAGCAVIKALPPPMIDMHLSGNTLRRRILERYWPVVQYRPQLSAVPSSALRSPEAPSDPVCPPGPCCAVDFADRIQPSLAPSPEYGTVAARTLMRSEHDQPVHPTEDHGNRRRIDRANGCYRLSVDGVRHTGRQAAG